MRLATMSRVGRFPSFQRQSVECQVRIVAANAIEVIAIGGPEVLKYVDKPRPSSRRGEVLIKAEAIGVYFVDTCFRSGLNLRAATWRSSSITALRSTFATV
jgi:hypothetical protein